jgi:hypothetical protein
MSQVYKVHRHETMTPPDADEPQRYEPFFSLSHDA